MVKNTKKKAVRFLRQDAHVLANRERQAAVEEIISPLPVSIAYKSCSFLINSSALLYIGASGLSALSFFRIEKALSI